MNHNKLRLDIQRFHFCLKLMHVWMRQQPILFPQSLPKKYAQNYRKCLLLIAYEKNYQQNKISGSILASETSLLALIEYLKNQVFRPAQLLLGQECLAAIVHEIIIFIEELEKIKKFEEINQGLLIKYRGLLKKIDDFIDTNPAQTLKTIKSNYENLANRARQVFASQQIKAMRAIRHVRVYQQWLTRLEELESENKTYSKESLVFESAFSICQLLFVEKEPFFKSCFSEQNEREVLLDLSVLITCNNKETFSRLIKKRDELKIKQAQMEQTLLSKINWTTRLMIYTKLAVITQPDYVIINNQGEIIFNRTNNFNEENSNKKKNILDNLIKPVLGFGALAFTFLTSWAGYYHQVLATINKMGLLNLNNLDRVAYQLEKLSDYTIAPLFSLLYSAMPERPNPFLQTLQTILAADELSIIEKRQLLNLFSGLLVHVVLNWNQPIKPTVLAYMAGMSAAELIYYLVSKIPTRIISKQSKSLLAMPVAAVSFSYAYKASYGYSTVFFSRSSCTAIERRKLPLTFSSELDEATALRKLGIFHGNSLTKEQLQKRFREFSLQFHPDKNGQISSKKYTEAVEAYNFLLRK